MSVERKYNSRAWSVLYKQYCKEKKLIFGSRQLNRRQYERMPLFTWMKFNDDHYDLLSMHELEQLADINFSFNARNTMAWIDRYIQLASFYKEHGHSRTTAKEKRLHGWCREQRTRRDKMDPRQKTMLERIEFSWDLLYDQWFEKFELMREFIEKYGHCKIPIYDPVYKDLVGWAKKQRSRKPRMEQRRIEMLDQIGFNWSPYVDEWEVSFQKLKKIYAKSGPWATITDNPEFEELFHWVIVQRRRYRYGNKTSNKTNHTALTKEQKKKLDSIGFIYERDEESWMEAYRELKEYYDDHGDLCLPNISTDYKSLCTWMRHQRNRKKKGTLPRNYIILLNKIDFPWVVNDVKWQTKYEELKAYKARTGRAWVVDQGELPGDEVLARWCRKQRSRRKQGKMTKEEYNKLRYLGFEWG